MLLGGIFLLGGGNLRRSDFDHSKKVFWGEANFWLMGGLSPSLLVEKIVTFIHINWSYQYFFEAILFPDCWKVSPVIDVFKYVGKRSVDKNYYWHQHSWQRVPNCPLSKLSLYWLPFPFFKCCPIPPFLSCFLSWLIHLYVPLKSSVLVKALPLAVVASQTVVIT